MAKKTNKKVSEKIASDSLSEKQKALIRKVFHRIDVACFAYQGGYIKLNSLIFLLGRFIYWLRKIESAPDNAIVSELMTYLADEESEGSHSGEKNAAE